VPVTIRTVIRDLYRNRSRGFRGTGMLAAGGGPVEDGTRSGFLRVRQAASPIVLTVDGAPEEFIRVARAPMIDANGFSPFLRTPGRPSPRSRARLARRGVAGQSTTASEASVPRQSSSA
jgi:hypothetical protein